MITSLYIWICTMTWLTNMRGSWDCSTMKFTNPQDQCIFGDKVTLLHKLFVAAKMKHVKPTRKEIATKWPSEVAASTEKSVCINFFKDNIFITLVILDKLIYIYMVLLLNKREQNMQTLNNVRTLGLQYYYTLLKHQNEKKVWIH